MEFNEVYHYGDLKSYLRIFLTDLFPYKESGVRYYHYQFSKYLYGKDAGVDDFKDDLIAEVVFKDFGFTIKKHRALTLAFDYRGFVGIALCSKHDQYIRKEGNKIALKRLKKLYKKMEK